MNLLGPDHRTSRAAVQSLARLAAGRVWRLNKDIFLLIRPSVVCPPRRRCTCSSQCLMYVFSSSSTRSACQPSLTVFLLLLLTDPNPSLDTTTHPHTAHLPSPPPSQLLIIGCGSKDGAGKSIGISSLLSRSRPLAHVLPRSGCPDNHSVLLLLLYTRLLARLVSCLKGGTEAGREGGCLVAILLYNNTLTSSKMNVTVERLHFRPSP